MKYLVYTKQNYNKSLNREALQQGIGHKSSFYVRPVFRTTILYGTRTTFLESPLRGVGGDFREIFFCVFYLN